MVLISREQMRQVENFGGPKESKQTQCKRHFNVVTRSFEQRFSSASSCLASATR